MKKAYFAICAILLVGLGVFYAFSRSDIDLKLGETEIKKGTFQETLFASDQHRVAKPGEKVPLPLSKKKSEKAEMDTTKKTILFIGDSMVECLFPRMSAYAKKNGHTIYCVVWYSSSTEIYGSRTTLKDYIKKFKPDYILITLGGNELFIRDIRQKRQKYVDEIIKQMGNIPFVWIGPPNWKDDTGINDMISESVPAGCFYLSYTPDQHYDRKKDGAHPKASSSILWADRICKWIMTKSAHPIRLEAPPAGETARPTKLELLQPLR
ncbi:MAG: SGNH/GDSL hydrolase family protein [Muribaculaceae bacterium]|nr:SGNH/GDSL hydrolase family protein [Muribaculaceae bacterium]